jgi:hypothetical protein
MTKTEIINVKIEMLKPSEYNPRIMSEAEMGKLKGSILEFGLVEPLVVNKDFTIIGGHQRYEALKSLGWKDIPCVFVDLSKEKEKVLNLALNKIQGTWDEFKLSEVISMVEDVEMLAKTGFEKEEVQLLQELLDVNVDYLTKDDKPITEAPAVYQLKLLFRAKDKDLYFELLGKYKGSDDFSKTASLLNYLKEKNGNR